MMKKTLRLLSEFGINNVGIVKVILQKKINSAAITKFLCFFKT